MYHTEGLTGCKTRCCYYLVAIMTDVCGSTSNGSACDELMELMHVSGEKRGELHMANQNSRGQAHVPPLLKHGDRLTSCANSERAVC